jgi:nucleoside-diphosphate-sugar epimerase
MSQVAIIGGSGFFAKHLVESLTRDGYRLTLFGRTRPTRLPDSISWMPLDIAKSSQKISHPEKSRVFHTVIFNSTIKGRYEHGSADWYNQGSVCAPNFETLFDHCGIKATRLITIGSSEEYGAKSDTSLILETDTCKPISSYGYWKCRLQDNAIKWSATNRSSHVHIRPFVVYGQYQDPQMFIGAIIETLMKGKTFAMTLGHQSRAFTHINTVSTVISKLVTDATWQIPVINVSDRLYAELREIAERIYSLINSGVIAFGALPYRHDEVWHQRPSLSILHSVLKDIAEPNFEKEIAAIVSNRKKEIACS